MMGKRKALLMTSLFVFFWRSEWFVLVLAAWWKGRLKEGCIPAKPPATVMGHLQPHGQRGPWCSRKCAAQLPSWPQQPDPGPAYTVGASALGTGGMGREG